MTIRHVDSKSREVPIFLWKIKVEFQDEINSFLQPASYIPQFMQPMIVNTFPNPALGDLSNFYIFILHFLWCLVEKD